MRGTYVRTNLIPQVVQGINTKIILIVGDVLVTHRFQIFLLSLKEKRFNVKLKGKSVICSSIDKGDRFESEHKLTDSFKIW